MTDTMNAPSPTYVDLPDVDAARRCAAALLADQASDVDAMVREHFDAAMTAAGVKRVGDRDFYRDMFNRAVIGVLSGRVIETPDE